MTMRLRIHPGEILKEEYLVPLNLSARALAKELGVPANRITSIINGTRSVTADTALKLGRYFRTTPQMWLNLQVGHDLSAAMTAESKPAAKRVRPRTRARSHRRTRTQLDAA